MPEATVTSLHPGRLSLVDYDRARTVIRETYGDSSGEAAAKRDQALAKLFRRSGWTQQELTRAEGQTRRWIDRRLRFGRFLDFGPMGPNLETSLSKITERRFRSYWDRTDKTETNERIRFQAVTRLIQESHLAAPRHHAIRSSLVSGFGDGKWHRPATMARHIDTDEDQVDRILTELSWPSNQRTAFKIERKKVGKRHEYRIFKTDRPVSVAELAEKLTPIIEDLQIQSERASGTISNSTIGRIAAQIRNLLDQWRE